MRFARVLLVVAVSFAGAGAAACHKSDAAAPAVVPGAPAGDVTEVAGDVTATRDGKTRALAVGDVVAGDDVVKTGGTGRVTIVLRHNKVPWSLGANQQKKVADSGAWAAAQGATAEAVTDDKSSAAGRHAERSATDTAASSSGSGAGSTAPTGAPTLEPHASDTQAVQDQAARADAERAALEQQLGAAQDAEKTAALRAELEKAEAEQRHKGDDTSAHAAKSGGGGGGGGGGKSTAKGHACDPSDPLCVDEGGPGGPSGPGGDTDVEGAVAPEQIQQVIQAHRPEFRRCFTRLAAKGHGKLVITFDVSAAGTVTKATVTGDPTLQPMFDCIHTAATALRFPHSTAPWSFRTPLVFASSD